MADDQKKVLIVDDDDGLRDTLADYLEQQGYGALQAANINDARQVLASGADLMLLDLTMPGGDSLTFLAEIKARNPVPTIIISGKSAMIDRVVGLEVGADDYLPKPFELRELLARIRSVLRRADSVLPVIGAHHDAASGQRRAAHFGGGLILLPGTRQVINQAGVVIELTSQEYNLVATLVERPGRVQPRDVIAGRIHRDAAASDDRNIDALVSRVRRKLSAHVDASSLIRTVRGEGYVLASEVRWTGEQP